MVPQRHRTTINIRVISHQVKRSGNEREESRVELVAAIGEDCLQHCECPGLRKVHPSGTPRPPQYHGSVARRELRQAGSL